MFTNLNNSSRTTEPTLSTMPRSDRKKLDASKPNERFGQHFRTLVDRSGLTVTELKDLLSKAGHEVSESAIRKWMRGDRYPDHELMEALGTALGLSDYRKILPPARRTRRR